MEAGHRHGFPYPAHDLSPFLAGSFSSASEARLDAHQHDEHSLAAGRFTASPHRRHLPNDGSPHGRNRLLVMDASQDDSVGILGMAVTCHPTQALRHRM